MIHLSLSLILACVIALSFPCSRGSAQQALQSNSEQPLVSLSGEIWGGDSGGSDWTVEIVACGFPARYSVTLREDGYFAFRGLTPGAYEIRVTDSKGSTLYGQMVSLSREQETLTIRVPATQPAQTSKAQTVSLQELQHKVPRKAMSEHRKGVTALNKRQFSSAVDHLKNAVEIDPAFASAQNNLGIAYFRLKEYDPSVDHLQRAIELAPGNQPANDNLCMLLLSLRRYAEAGQVADRALKLGSDSAVAHYTVAVSILAGGGSTVGVLEHLRHASDEIPKSHLLAARVLAKAGRRADAAHEVEAYLRSPQTGSDRTEVEEWLAALKQ